MGARDFLLSIVNKVLPPKQEPWQTRLDEIVKPKNEGAYSVRMDDEQIGAIKGYETDAQRKVNEDLRRQLAEKEAKRQQTGSSLETNTGK